MNIEQILCSEFNLKPQQAANTVKLIDEGNTIPFIARYRKEVTGSLDDEVLRNFDERLKYLRSFEERKEEIIKHISELGLLTPELSEKINSARILQELEDIYLPFRPKRRTRATVAKEKGLEPLADRIYLQADKIGNPLEIAAEFVNGEMGVNTPEEAIDGAKDIIAESVSDNADVRRRVRNLVYLNGFIESSAAKDEKSVYETYYEFSQKVEDSVYRMYYEFSEPVKTLANHRVLAINRGEKDGFLKVGINADEERIIGFLLKQILKKSIYDNIIEETVRDSYDRLISPSIEREVRNSLTAEAEKGAIKLFGELGMYDKENLFKGISVQYAPEAKISSD